MKKVVCLALLVIASGLADLKKDALKFVPQGWEVDPQEMVVADFNRDGTQDIALIYYKVDPDFDNRINRVLVLLTGDKELVPIVDQRFPADQDFGTEVMIDYADGILRIFQHMGFMHKFNEWGLAWDEFAERFWERTYASGGILGLGSVTGYDALTGLGYVEKIWEDVDVSAEYSTIYAEEASGKIKLDGQDSEADWHRAWVADNYWVTYGVGNWGEVEDASIEIRALYDQDNLYLFIEVLDDEIIHPNSLEGVLKSDHIEIWFDALTPEVVAELPGYAFEIWERKQDSFVNQLAIAQSASGELLTARWLPASSDDLHVPDIKAGFCMSENAWIAELSIPWVEFGPYGVQDYLSLTLVYSDSDNPSKPKQDALIATSQLRWAEPFTFGSLLTYKPDRVYWGVYPEED